MINIWDVKNKLNKNKKEIQWVDIYLLMYNVIIKFLDSQVCMFKIVVYIFFIGVTLDKMLEIKPINT